jgi:hypothetical protein
LVVNKGGEGSKLVNGEVMGLLEAGSEGPFIENTMDPIHCDAPIVDSVEPIPAITRQKGGRIKKSMRKPHPYHPYLPGSKQRRLYDLSKASSRAKRRNGSRGGVSGSSANSNESDPIANSHGDAQAVSDYSVHDDDGILLEVVLPSAEVVEVLSGDRPIATSGPGGGGNGNSGLAMLIGEQGNLNNGDTVSDWMVEKERGDAHHIIDIQEELGVTFGGEVEENVEKCMKMEQRDRMLKNGWEQSNGYQ